jgi:hypothetical protein
MAVNLLVCVRPKMRALAPSYCPIIQALPLLTMAVCTELSGGHSTLTVSCTPLVPRHGVVGPPTRGWGMGITR